MPRLPAGAVHAQGRADCRGSGVGEPGASSAGGSAAELGQDKHNRRTALTRSHFIMSSRHSHPNLHARTHFFPALPVRDARLDGCLLCVSAQHIVDVLYGLQLAQDPRGLVLDSSFPHHPLDLIPQVFFAIVTPQ